MSIPKILSELFAKVIVSKQLLAVKMGVSERTIDRWSKGETSPNFAEKKLLKRIYNGFIAQEKRKK